MAPQDIQDQSVDSYTLVVPINVSARWNNKVADDLEEAIKAAGLCPGDEVIRIWKMSTTVTVYVPGKGSPEEFKRSVLDLINSFLLGYPGFELRTSSVRVESDND